MDNKGNKYVVKNYKERLYQAVQSYGLDKLYGELCIQKGSLISDMSESEKSKHKRNFRVSVNSILKGKGLLNNIEDLVFTLDQLEINFHELLTGDNTFIRETIQDNIDRKFDIINSLPQTIANVVSEKKLAQKRQKNKKLNEKSFSYEYRFNQQIKYEIDFFSFNSINIGRSFDEVYNKFDYMFSNQFNNGSLNTSRFDIVLVDRFYNLLSNLISDKKFRRKLKSTKYHYVLKSLILIHITETGIDSSQFDIMNFTNANLKHNFNNLMTISTQDGTAYYLSLAGVYLSSLHSLHEYLNGINNITNIQSNLETLKNIIRKFEELLDKIIPILKNKTLDIDADQLLNLVNSISKLCKVSYEYESRFTSDFNINFLLSWFSMNYFYRPEIDVEPIESNAIEEIQLFIDSLPEPKEHFLKNHINPDDIFKGNF